MRRNIFYFLPLLFLLGFSCCHDDDDDGETASFVLDIKAMHGNDPLVLGQTYQNDQGYNFNVTLFRFYLSHLVLTKADGSEVEVKDIDYLNFENHHTESDATGEEVTGTIPAGDYTSMRFAIGVDSTLNYGDPSVYPSTHPLSIYNGAHWGWNTGYRFLMWEGHIDSVANGNSSLPVSYSYHTGTMPLYREVQFDDDFTVAANGTVEYKLKLDADRLFYSATDTLDVVHDNFTHSGSDWEIALAQRVTDFVTGALSRR